MIDLNVRKNTKDNAKKKPKGDLRKQQNKQKKKLLRVEKNEKKTLSQRKIFAAMTNVVSKEMNFTSKSLEMVKNIVLTVISN